MPDGLLTVVSAASGGTRAGLGLLLVLAVSALVVAVCPHDEEADAAAGARPSDAPPLPRTTGATAPGAAPVAPPPRAPPGPPPARVAVRALPPLGEATAPPASPSDAPAGEPVADPAECDGQCGAPCVTDAEGEPRCPAPCQSDDQCDEGALCVMTRPTATERRRRCLRSECSGLGAHTDCGAGRACRLESRAEGGVWLCRDAGRQGAGDHCGFDTAGPEATCGAGLQCVAGICRPETCADSEDCGPGARCLPVGGADHRTCAAYCADGAECADRHVCRDLPTGERRCVPRARASCLETGCPEGEDCQVVSPFEWSFAAACVRACDPTDPRACGRDAVCGLTDDLGNAVCHRKCDPGCPAGFTCGAVTDGRDAHPACVPDLGAPLAARP